MQPVVFTSNTSLHPPVPPHSFQPHSNSFPLSPHLNLSLPLQRASSHISLTLHDKREETLLDQVAADARIQNLESETQARRISVGEAAAPSLPSRNSPNTRASPSQLSRHQSQVEICQTRVNSGSTSCKFSLLPDMSDSCHQFSNLSFS